MKQLDQRAYEGILENPNMTIDVIDELLEGRNKLLISAIAKSPIATTAQLELVYKKNKSADIIYALATNPNTPPDILEKCYQKGCEVDVCQNPSIPRSLMTHYLKGKVPSGIFDYRCIAQNPSLSSKKDQLALAKKMDRMNDLNYLFLNPNLHSEVFQYLWDKGERGSFASSSLHCTREQVIMLCNFQDGDDSYEISSTRASGFRSELCPESLIKTGRSSENWHVRNAAFSNGIVPVNFHELDFEDLAMVTGIVRRDDVPEDILLRIAAHDSPRFGDAKFSLTFSMHASVSVLEMLLLQGEDISSNPNMTLAMVENYINGGDSYCRYRALKHPSLSLERLKDLLGFKDGNVDLHDMTRQTEERKKVLSNYFGKIDEAQGRILEAISSCSGIVKIVLEKCLGSMLEDNLDRYKDMMRDCWNKEIIFVDPVFETSPEGMVDFPEEAIDSVRELLAILPERAEPEIIIASNFIMDLFGLIEAIEDQCALVTEKDLNTPDKYDACLQALTKVDGFWISFEGISYSGGTVTYSESNSRRLFQDNFELVAKNWGFSLEFTEGTYSGWIKTLPTNGRK
jgi:hypothetical protein